MARLLTPGRTPADFQPLAQGQYPIAHKSLAVRTHGSRRRSCSIRESGTCSWCASRAIMSNGAGAAVKGSVEYAVAVLRTFRLIMILGTAHAAGAVKSRPSTAQGSHATARRDRGAGQCHQAGRCWRRGARAAIRWRMRLRQCPQRRGEALDGWTRLVCTGGEVGQA